ncbi:signal recognition particle-docking protein FtsY [Ligilactobacillus cholophilus]|uniref:signal recognition particle-docking protein FtsY n=1 Tax=Ligilactobacillus cholophilus TaxID=3050131 RepID=UPI0025B20F22|nr:signal recognition particle-docking protein FtsY [Ligilactobacillus cholophilus]
MGLFNKLKKAFGFEDEEEKKQATQDETETKNSDELSDDDKEIKQESKELDKEIDDEHSETETETETGTETETEWEITTDNANQEEVATNEEKEEKNEKEHYTHGLKKTRAGFKGRINALLANFRHVDEDFFDDLEEMLIESDVGFDAAMKISDELRDEVKFQNAKTKDEVSEVIVEKLVDLYEEAGKNEDEKLHFSKDGLTVFLFVGVNGVGKTTTIGKLANRFKKEGKKVLLAAGDTFRAGAIQQLDEWAQRVGVDIVKKEEKSDPAAVVFDAITKAKKENYDILLIDTAGRLQNKVNLMNELEKIQRIITRELPDAPHEVLLALDATTGQNALTQAKQFKDVTNVSGIILTKLDGTARGGIVLAIRNELHIPVKLVGLGEKVDDLRDFNTEDFAYGLFKGLITPKKD